MIFSISEHGNLQYVDVAPLKRWAANSLPTGSRLRELLVLEKDKLPVDKFLAKMDTWLKSFDLEELK